MTRKEVNVPIPAEVKDYAMDAVSKLVHFQLIVPACVTGNSMAMFT